MKESDRHSILEYCLEGGILLLCSIPFLAKAFWDLYWWDDEGVFLVVASNMQKGYKPYVHMPLLYGPLVPWFNYAALSPLGWTLCSSRLVTCALVLLTTILSYAAARRIFDSCLLRVLAPLLWIMSASEFFKEGIHPGWLIAFLVALEGYILVAGSKRSAWFLLGVLAGLIGALKPQMGFCNGYALLVLLLLRVRWPLSIKLLVSGAFAAVWLLVGYKMGWASSPSPALALAEALFWPLVLLPIPVLFVLNRTFRKTAESNGSVNYVFMLVTGTAATLAISYGIAFSLYGFRTVVENIFGVVWSEFLPFAGSRISNIGAHAGYQLSPLIFGFVLALIAKNIRYHILAVLTLYWAVVSVHLPAFLAFGWPFIIVAAVMKSWGGRRHVDEGPLCISILCLCNLPHIIPIPAPQVVFATPLAYLVCLYLLREFIERGLLRARYSIFFIGPALLVVVALTAGTSAYRLFAGVAPSKLFGMGPVRLPGYTESVLGNLSEFVKGNNRPGDTFLSLGGENNLNVMLNLPQPSPLVSGMWLKSPPKFQLQLLPSLKSTRFMVLPRGKLPRGKRILAWKLRAHWRRKFPIIYVLRTRYRKVPTIVWNRGEPYSLGLVLYERKKGANTRTKTEEVNG